MRLDQPGAAHWRSWCASRHISPHEATVDDVVDAVLDCALDGAQPGELVDLLDAAGEMTGTWGTSRYASLRLCLEAPGDDVHRAGVPW